MKKYSHLFAVEGSGHFPYDMLRYDECHPVSGEDAARIEPHQSGLRVVHLRSDSHDGFWLPTAARWSSFTWTVVDHVKEKVAA